MKEDKLQGKSADHVASPVEQPAKKAVYQAPKPKEKITVDFTPNRFARSNGSTPTPSSGSPVNGENGHAEENGNGNGEAESMWDYDG